MNAATQIFACSAAACGLAIALARLLVRLQIPVWLLTVACSSVLFTPLIIAAGNVKLRAFACVVSIELFFKTVDYVTQWRLNGSSDRRFGAFLAFLVPFPVLLVRFGQRSHRRAAAGASVWYGTLAAMGCFGICFASLGWLEGVEFVRSSFLIDHSIKFILFTVAIEALARSLHGLERLAGYDTRPIVDRAYCSRTVGEFWWRYNTRIHAWFDFHVFRQSGGRRRPVRAVFLTFLISAVLHELGFAIATSRLDGYQFTFFMVQAPAVFLWRRFERTAGGSATGQFLLHGSTILWMWATSMLFFHGVNRVFPFFYASTPWLP